MIMENWHRQRDAVRRGYTLLELLFVVAIIGVLALVATAIYSRAIDKGNYSAAIADMGELEFVIERSRSSNFTLPDALPTPRLDPWGNPYIYTKLEGVRGRGKARKDHALNPLNTDFDLFSAGKNGTYKTQISHKDSLDDIIRARNGAYIGLGADF